MQQQKEAMEAHAAQEERHEQGKRRAKLEAGFAEVALSCHHLHLHDATPECTDDCMLVPDSFHLFVNCVSPGRMHCLPAMGITDVCPTSAM